jgi:hypothetical protein
MTTPKSADRQASSNGGGKNGAGNGESTGSARETVGEVAANVRGAAETVAARLPEAAAQTRAVVDEAARRMETGSDEMLTAGTTLSLGLAIGMLVSGAPRLLVALALIPAAAMGLTLLDRNGSRSGAGRSRTA